MLIFGFPLRLFVAAALIGTDSPPAPRIIFEPSPESAQSLPNLIDDGGFERADGWKPYGSGFEIDPKVMHSGNQSIRCTARDIQSTYGAVTTLHPKQKTAAPLVLELWTRNEGLEFPPSDDYSLYADLTYADGTRDWAQLARCPTGSKDWQRVELLLHPTRPVESLDFYCLFRKTAGTVWFDDAACREVDPTKVHMFDGEFVSEVDRLESARPRIEAEGLNLAGVNDSVVVLIQSHAGDRAIRRVSLEPCACTNYAMWCYTFHDLASATRGRVSISMSQVGSLSVAADVTTTRATTQPVTVFVGNRCAGCDRWWIDGRDGVPIDANGDYANLCWTGAGKTGYASRYPIAVVSGRGNGWAILGGRGEIDSPPRLARFGYYAPFHFLYAACDLLARTEQSPRPEGPLATADVSLAIQPGTFGITDFRTAWARLLDQLPCQLVGMPYGTWLPFTPISRIERPEDFGFAFHEVGEASTTQPVNGVTTFHYQAEPQSLWLKMKPATPRTYDACVQQLHDAANDEKHPQHQQAADALPRVCRGVDGRFVVRPVTTPWCDGCVLVLDPQPQQRRPGRYTGPTATPNWRVRRLLGSDGDYYDSIDANGDVLDFDADHVKAARWPTFDPITHRPCALTAISTYEYLLSLDTRWDHLRDRPRMANFCPTRYGWMAECFDVMGQEVNWRIGGQWSPMSPEDMWYRRALCGKKPYCLLMNADFDRWTVADTRRYFMRCAAYAFLPSFFSHNAYDRNYWENPACYNRDRPLFKQFIPVIRELARAGWEPVTRARAESPLLVERFQDGETSPIYWTVHNPTDRSARGRVWFVTAPPPSGKLRELLTASDRSYSMDGNELRLDVELKPDETLVLRADYPPASAPAGP